MKSFIRKLAITGGVAAVLLAAGGTTAKITAHAATATGDVSICTVAGHATITPGLGPVPTAEQFTIDTGTISCHGTFSGTGSISGGGTCTLGSLETCVGGLISFNASAGGHAAVGTNCLLTQEGPQVQVICTPSQGNDNGAGAVILANVVFTPNPAVQNPVREVDFNGVAAIIG